MFELDGVEVLGHSSIRIAKEKIIYIDPFRIKKDYNDADLVLCTHSHYDHFSIDDIRKVKKDDTMILVTEDVKEEAMLMGVNPLNVVGVKPYQEFEFEDISIETIPAYNKFKEFHPKEKEWVRIYNRN